MRVSTAFESGLIPLEYKGVFPTHCKCGSEIEISDTLTRMWCPNEKCDNKQIARMCKMLTKFEVKDIGISYCRDLWYAMKRVGLADSPVSVFELALSDYPETFSYEVTLKKFNSIQNVIKDSIFVSGYSLGDLVSRLSLPHLDMNARKLFAGFNSLREFQVLTKKAYGDIGMYRHIRKRFGGKVISDQIMHTLATFAKDIQKAERLFNIKKSTGREVKVAITGRVTKAGHYTRKEFVRYCNDLCDGIVEVIDTAPSSSISFVIADESSGSDKYSYGLMNNILMSSDEFITWLKKEVIDGGR